MAHFSVQSTSHHAANRVVRDVRLVRTNTSVDNDTANCVTGMFCGPLETTEQKIARVVLYTVTGALVGTAIEPGAGTAIGAGIGAAAGIASVVANS